MPEITAHAPGTPSWIDLSSPDLGASIAFYGALFGWEAWETGTVEETGGYRMFGLRDQTVAGLGPIMNEGQPPAWSTYVTVEDASATADKVRAAGGRVLVEPMDVMAAGRMAVFMDPEGAAFSIWQPGESIGAGIVNEPGTLAWNELSTRDVDGAERFYGEVFGWGAETSPMPGPNGPVDYTGWQVGGKAVGGALPMPEGVPAEVPPFWLVYFAVEDTDAAVAKAKELGASVVMEPVDIPAGRFAVVVDPQGAVFGVIALAEGAGP